MTDTLRDAIAAMQADDAPTERECGYQDAIDEVLRILDARAALVAAPQPAPMDREALVEVIEGALREWGAYGWLRTGTTGFIADALLARGLRLPSQDDALQQLADLGQQADRASETMAWAVLGEDGEVIPGSIYPTRDEAERVCDYEGERVVRVAIRKLDE